MQRFNVSGRKKLTYRNSTNLIGAVVAVVTFNVNIVTIIFFSKSDYGELLLQYLEEQCYSYLKYWKAGYSKKWKEFVFKWW